MKIKEIREKSEKELKGLLAEKRDKLMRVRFDLASKKAKNPKEGSQLKKDIARILTIISEAK